MVDEKYFGFENDHLTVNTKDRLFNFYLLRPQAVLLLLI